MRLILYRLFTYCCLLAFILTAPLAFAIEYAVGPGQPLSEIEEVPWESLSAGDTVLIYWREQPYRSKWVITAQGREDEPVIVRGIPNERGDLPIIDGRDAVTRNRINFWSEQRGIIKIGGSNTPADTMPSYVIIENLDIRSARPPFSFTGRNGLTAYSSNAASIFIEKGERITVRNCILHDSGNGLFIAHQSRDILIEGCYIHDNGIEGSIYEHNTYTSALGLTYQFNRFGRLRQGCLGNNLKDRSAGLTVRYNWIEDGNRQLDLVDAGNQDELRSNPRYRQTFVYGNILIESDGEGNSQIMHYGGDSGNTNGYRKGTLFFYNNTVVSTRSGNTTLVRLSTSEESMDCRNNILYTTAPGSRFAIIDGAGRADLKQNWLKQGFVRSHGTLTGEVLIADGNLRGNEPGFTDVNEQDFHLRKDSSSINAAIEPHLSVSDDHRVEWQYQKHRMRELRPKDGILDLGALEAYPLSCLREFMLHE